MSENMGKEYANLALNRFYDTATNNIQTSALVNRALADKISTETINQKVNNQLNSIYTQMNRINPKFNESSKNYGIVKQDILDVLTDYEIALTEFSDYYDNMIEELISKKVELESNFVGIVFKENSLKMNENNSDDSSSIKKLQDIEALGIGKNNRVSKNISKVQEKNKTNQSQILEIENEIKKISKQINEINEKKRLGLEEAMETREKWISITLRKPSVWSRTKSFFSNRFSTVKVVSKTVIAPLKTKVKEFRMNELQELKR